MSSSLSNVKVARVKLSFPVHNQGVSVDYLVLLVLRRVIGVKYVLILVFEQVAGVKIVDLANDSGIKSNTCNCLFYCRILVISNNLH